MAPDSVDSLDALAAKVEEAFDSHSQSKEFKTVSLVIDSSRSDRPHRREGSWVGKRTVLRNSVPNTVLRHTRWSLVKSPQ